MGKVIIVKNSSSANQLRNAMNLGNTLVLYHANWCGHCQRFQPDWKKLQTRVKKELPNVCLGDVEETQMRSHMKDSEVQGFPTIKFYRKSDGSNKANEENKNNIPFEGERSVDGLINFIKANMKSESNTPSNVKNNTKQTKGNIKTVVINNKMRAPGKNELKKQLSHKLRTLFNHLTQNKTQTQQTPKNNGNKMLRTLRRSLRKVNRRSKTKSNPKRLTKRRK